MNRGNQRRAKTAGAALAEYRTLTATGGEEAVTDLIADLGHYCEAHSIDFLASVRRGLAHWASECGDPESEDLQPAVSIQIDGGVP